MKGFEFGTAVVVKAIAHRVIRNDRGFEPEFPERSEPVEYHERGTVIAPAIAESVAWPARDGKPYARVVREVLDSPGTGIVVGHTNRQEGYRHPGGYSGSYDGEPDYEPAAFIQTRVVSLVEVALSVGPRQKARVVLVEREDLEAEPVE